MNESIMTLEESKFVKFRETHIGYTESLGDSQKTFSIDTYLAFDELITLVSQLKDGAK